MKLPAKPIRNAFVIICLLGVAYVGITIANVEQYVNDQTCDSIKLGLIVILCVVGYFSGRAFFQFTRTTPVFLLAMAFLILFHLTELTEEFAVFGPVPLFGELTLAKRAFETILMIGSICLLLGGIYLSVFEINKARKQLVSQVHFLKATAQIDQIVRQAHNQEQMMRNILNTALSVLECDRAFVLYPCDPDSETCGVPIECTKAGYAHTLAEELPVTARLAEAFRSVLACDGPLAMAWPSGECEWDTDDQFGVRSQLVTAVRPNRDRPWVFGVQRCEDARVWTEQEQRLFEAIGRRLTDGLNSHQLNRRLRESEERNRRILDTMQDCLAIVDPEGRFVLANAAFCHEYGYSLHELMGLQATQLIHPDYHYLFEQFREQIRTTGEFKAERVDLRKDGTTFNTEVRGTAIEIDGKPFSLAVIRDVTQRKKAEDAIRDSEARYRGLFDHANDAIFLMDFDRFIECNNKTMDVYGCSKEHIIGRTPYDPFSPECQSDGCRSKEKALEKIRLAQEGQTQFFEWSHLKYDGTPFEAEVSLNPIELTGKTYIQAIARDVTEHKQAERARLAHISFLESLDHVNQAIHGASDLDQMMTDVLDAALSVFKCDRAWLLYPCDPEAPTWRVPMERTVPEYPGALALDVDVPMDQGVAGVLRTMLGFNGPVKFGPGSKYPLPHESAKQFRFQSQMSMAIHPKVGKPWMFGLHQCSHPRIWTEEEEKLFEEIGRRIADSMSSMLTFRDLRQSQERYRALVENANLGIALISKDFEILMSNPTQGRMMEKDHRDFIGCKCYVELEKRDEVCPHCPGKRAMETGHPHEVETEGVRADGTTISVRVQASPVYGADGCIEGFVEVVEDITERKQAQQALLRREEQYRRVVEDQTEFIVRWRPDGTRTFVNESYCRHFGLSCDEAIGHSFFPLIEPEDLLAVKKRFESITPENPVSSGEHRVIRADGSIGWNHWMDRGIFDEKGQLIEYQSVGRDITERKQAEEELRESEKRLRSLSEAAFEGITFSEKGVIADANEACAKIFGYSLDEMKGKRIIELVAPEHRELVAENIRTGYVKIYEHKGLRKNGSVVDLEVQGRGVTYQGREMRLTAIRDITERKRAEIELRHERDRAQTYLDVAAVMFVVLDSTGKVSLINRKGCAVLGCREDEILGKDWFGHFLPSQDQQRVREVFQKLIAGELRPAEYTENPVVNRSGQERLMAWHNTVLRDPAGNIIGTLSSGQDITERKKAEKRLRNYQVKLKSLASELALAEERERRRIAAGIHDDMAQKLAMAKLELQTLGASFSDESIASSLEAPCNLIDEIVQDARELVFDLGNAALYQVGLEAAIETWLQQEIQAKHGLKCELVGDTSGLELDDDTQITLFRAVKELLANTVKYADASKVVVHIRKIDDSVSVSVEDDGAGFDVSALDASFTPKGGFGLFNIKERLEHLGGSLEIDSGPGEGTRVIMTAPLEQEVTTG